MKTYNEKLRSISELYAMNDSECKRNTTEYNSLEVSIVFQSGGYSYFTGQHTPRGYYLRSKPISVNGGFRSFTMLGTGFDNGISFIVAEAKRFSKKELFRLADKTDFQEIGHSHAAGETQKIQSMIETLRL